MARKLFALATGAFALLLVASTFDSADARGRGGGGGRGFHGGGHARAFSGRAFHAAPVFRGGGHRFVRRGIGVGLVGVPLAYGAYYYGSGYYDGGCSGLRRRALATGSGYWWDRYRACLDGYNY